MNPLDLVKLTALMERSTGRPEVKVGLIDGPVVTQHPDLAGENLQDVPGNKSGTCTQVNSIACLHGTFVAGILSAKRGSIAPAICPNCTLLVRPIFAETTAANGEMPSTTPEELAQAVHDCIAAGAQILNVSAALAQPTSKNERALAETLGQAARHGVLVIVAAGNQGTLGSTAITRHPGVIPVVAYNHQGRLMGQSNLGKFDWQTRTGRPGDRITGLGTDGEPITLGGTSAAAPFVTGAIALLWSIFPQATAAQIKLAITQACSGRRAAVVPPLLDAWASYQYLLTMHARRALP